MLIFDLAIAFLSPLFRASKKCKCFVSSRRIGEANLPQKETKHAIDIYLKQNDKTIL